MPHQEELKKARKTAIKYLAYRDRSRSEISCYLVEKKISPGTVKKTLAYLEKNRYIDDPRFALQFGRSRIENKRVGKLRLRRELRGKGLDDSLIDKTLDFLYAEHDESEIALACAKKKLASFGPGDTKKKRGRLARFLERQGYPASIVYQAVNQLIPPSSEQETEKKASTTATNTSEREISKR